MTDKIRLYNRTKMNIGIKTATNPLGINIRPGSFTLVDQNDLDFLIGTTTLLSSGWLQAEGPEREEILEKIGIEPAEESAFMSDEEIRKKLNANGKTLEKWLDGITDPIQLDRIADMAMEMNLSVSKIKILQAKIPYRDLMEE